MGAKARSSTSLLISMIPVVVGANRICESSQMGNKWVSDPTQIKVEPKMNNFLEAI